MTSEEKYDREQPTIHIDHARMQAIVGDALGSSAKIQDMASLPGGFGNTNYRVQAAGRSYVVRFTQRPLEQFKKEVAVLERLRDEVMVPKIIHSDFESETPFALFQYIEGRPLSEVLPTLAFSNQVSSQGREQAPAQTAADLARSVGEVLAGIHETAFEEAGFFDAQFEFAHPFDNFGQAYLAYMRDQLKRSKVRARMGEDLARDVEDYLTVHGPEVLDLRPSTILIHCDFNPKNILVNEVSGQWRVTGVLDWEFAASGSPLVDLGNFLRFEHEFPKGFAEAFIEGYQVSGTELPDDWREQARLLDLASMLSVLASEHEKPKAFATAITVCQRTVGG